MAAPGRGRVGREDGMRHESGKCAGTLTECGACKVKVLGVPAEFEAGEKRGERCRGAAWRMGGHQAGGPEAMAIIRESGEEVAHRSLILAHGVQEGRNQGWHQLSSLGWVLLGGRLRGGTVWWKGTDLAPLQSPLCLKNPQPKLKMPSVSALVL